MLNTKVLIEAASIRVPTSIFPVPAAATTANMRLNIDALILLFQQEEVEFTKRIGWIDEMTPAARVTLIAYLLALKAASV